MTLENNKVLHELMGKDWHEPVDSGGKMHSKKLWPDDLNPDYADDPRLVLEGMKYASNFQAWLDSMVLNELPNLGMIKVNLILDRTGRLRDLGIEFLKEGGK